MHRIDTSTALKDKFGVGKNGFTRGNPQTGTPATDLDDDYFDMLQEELVSVVEESGITLNKNKHNQLLSALQMLFNGAVGDIKKARMSVPVASSSASFTADSLVVEDAGGCKYRLQGFSADINLGTTGAGGMDTGTVPVTGFLALYAIYNPASGNKALLAVNATAAPVPEIYGGANMPAGYTASALVSVWPVAASKFIIGFQQGRKLDVQLVSAVTISTPNGSYSPFSIAALVPANAKAWSGAINISGTQSVVGIVASDSGGLDAARVAATGASGAAISTSAPFRDVSIITPQTAFYFFTASGSSSINIFMSGYIF